jgi:hypothetical protein
MRTAISRRIVRALIVLGVLLCAVDASLLLASEPPGTATAVIDAPPEATWKSADKALRDAGYRIVEDNSPTFVSGRIGRPVRHWGEEDEAVKELRRICRFDERMSLSNLKRFSEYYVTLDVQVHDAEPGKSRVVVIAKIIAVERTRGRRGMPRPTGLPSLGVAENDLLQKIREGVGMPPVPPS